MLEDLENLTRDCNRRQLTTVILEIRKHQAVDTERSTSLQETCTEHQDDLQLFLVLQREFEKWPDRETDYRNVHCNLHSCLVPRKAVDVNAAALVSSCPTRPKVWHGGALENHDKCVGDSKGYR